MQNMKQIISSHKKKKGPWIYKDKRKTRKNLQLQGNKKILPAQRPVLQKEVIYKATA